MHDGARSSSSMVEKLPTGSLTRFKVLRGKISQRYIRIYPDMQFTGICNL